MAARFAKPGPIGSQVKKWKTAKKNVSTLSQQPTIVITCFWASMAISLSTTILPNTIQRSRITILPSPRVSRNLGFSLSFRPCNESIELSSSRSVITASAASGSPGKFLTLPLFCCDKKSPRKKKEEERILNYCYLLFSFFFLGDQTENSTNPNSRVCGLFKGNILFYWFLKKFKIGIFFFSSRVQFLSTKYSVS